MNYELPHEGILCKTLAELVPKPPTPKPARIVVVGCGLRVHFPWDLACDRFRAASEVVRTASAGLPAQILAAPEPFESPDDLLGFLDQQLAEGVSGIILFHAAYTAGEIGSHLGRWLVEHPVPLMSWAWPEPGNRGRNEANSLTCQNFLLNMLAQMGVPYFWAHAPIADQAALPISRFIRACFAKASFRHSRLLHAGGSRVTAFYDGETNELAVMKSLGCRFDRVDLEFVYQHARKRFRDADVELLKQALVSSPRCERVDLPQEQILQTYRFGLAMLDLAATHGYSGATVKSWPDLFDCYGCAIDGAVSMMNDFGFVVAEEGEMNGLVSSLALQFCSAGQAVPTMMDLSLWKQEINRLGIWHCGASPTRWLKPGTSFAATKHSILENGNSETAVGLMLEFLLAEGPVTLVRYAAPSASACLAVQGSFVETELDYRGSYGLFEMEKQQPIGQFLGTILDLGLDHHWSLGRGHWHEELKLLNHFASIKEIPLRTSASPFGLSSPHPSLYHA